MQSFRAEFSENIVAERLIEYKFSNNFHHFRYFEQGLI